VRLGGSDGMRIVLFLLCFALQACATVGIDPAPRSVARDIKGTVIIHDITIETQTVTPPPVAPKYLQWDASAVNQACCDAGDCTGCDGCCPATGYKIHWGVASGVYTGVEDVGNVLTWRIPDSWMGPLYFVASAYNASGSSGYSNQVLFVRYVGASVVNAIKTQK